MPYHSPFLQRSILRNGRINQSINQSISFIHSFIFFQFLATDWVEGPVYADGDKPLFPGSRSKFTEKLEFVEPDIYDGIPVYRVMDKKGCVLDPSQDPGVSLLGESRHS
jgi:2-oxoisovalerate dehydrogenase E1 component alpha subunit